MSSQFEKEKNKLIQEKCQNILTGLLKDEDNKYCVDCDAKTPRWASWNLGIFLCIRCAGIHRNLGVHISRVKSVNLDSWTPQQVVTIQQMGNSRARAVYEANLPDNFRRPQTDSSLEQFIRSKYESKKYIAREWVEPPLSNPMWDVEIEKQLKRKREKKISGGKVDFPVTTNKTTKTSGVSPKPLPKAPGGRNSSPSHQTKRSSIGKNILDETEGDKTNAQDLLGLDIPASNGTAVNESTDPFGDFLAAPSKSSETSPDNSKKASQSEESQFFNQKLQDSSEKMSKDSILALYSKAPPVQTQQNQVFGGGMYMAAPVQGSTSVPVISGSMLPSMVPNQGIIPQAQSQNVLYFQQQMGGPVPYSTPGNASNSPMFQGINQSMGLSAANPFSQMQNQMANMSLGGYGNPMPVLGSGPGVSNLPPVMGMMGGLSQNTLDATRPSNTLSTDLWQ